MRHASLCAPSLASAGNWNTWHVRDRAADLLVGVARLIARAQPGRVLVMPTEMGFLRCAADGTAAGFVHSWESLVSRRPGGGAETLRQYASYPHPIIGTFHF